MLGAVGDFLMAVILRNCDLFIHVPRCGGSYTIELLNALGLVRLRMPSAPHVPPHFFNFQRKVFKFGFVRHPWEWLKSYYRLKFATARHPAIWLDNMIDESKGFEDWIGLIYAKPGFQVVGDYMYNFIGRGSSRIDFVGRYENLREDLERAMVVGNLLGPGDPSVGDVYSEKGAVQFDRPLSDGLRDFVISRESELVGEFYPGG